MLTYRQDGEKWRIDMKKWFSMELNRVEWAGIRPILKEFGCRYEAGGCGTLVHVEVYCDIDTADAINTAIDSIDSL